jgi:copper oxidase (laccase) domain-containing protein
VGPEFKNYLASYEGKHLLQQRMNNYFFDMPLFIFYQLQSLGIAQKAIETAYNMCTICDNRFYSHRRSVANFNGRQMTVVALK